MPTGHFRFRRSLGNVNGRLFRGARPLGTTPAFSAEALNYFSRLDTAGDTTYVDYKQPLANYIDGLIAAGMWDGLESAASFVGVGIEGVAVPLKAGMPTITNNNFVDADLDQLTGLKGNGSTKYIGTNLFGTSLSLNDTALTCWITDGLDTTVGHRYMSADANSLILSSSDGTNVTRFRTNTATITVSSPATTETSGLVGWSRDNSTDHDWMVMESSGTVVQGSSSTGTGELMVIGNSNVGFSTNRRFAAYTAGASLDLAVLKGLQATLLSEIAAI